MKKGLILAGGRGTRLLPATSVMNKHMIPILNRPMILYPLDTLRDARIREIMIVCGKEHGGDFMNFLGSGKEYGVKLSYALQHGSGGIPEALGLAEDFVGGDSMAVVLGDNIFEDNFTRPLRDFKKGAAIFLKKVSNPERFGVAVFDRTGKKILRIEEKPKKPTSSYVQTGLFLFDTRIFDVIRDLKPSGRGELEISDAVNTYLNAGELSHDFVKGFWSDAGKFDSLLQASQWVAKRSASYARH